MEAKNTPGGSAVLRASGKRRERDEEAEYEAQMRERQLEEDKRLEWKRGEREEVKKRKEVKGIPSGMVASATTLPSSRLSREEMSRTMPRHIDSTTLQVIPPSQKRGPLPTFPNPYAGQEMRKDQKAGHRGEWEKIPRNKTPYSPLLEIPPTPPLNLPAQAFGAQTKRHQKNVQEEDEEEDDERSRWSSGESTPTPTASSVAAASARRKQEAKTMKPVKLTSPVQMMNRPPVEPIQKRSMPLVTIPVQSTKEQERPLSSSSIKLADGREIATVRTDFANLKKINRPSSASQVNSTSTQASMVNTKGKGKDKAESPPPTKMPATPILTQEKAFPASPPSRPDSEVVDLSTLEAQRGNRNTFGPDSTLFNTVDMTPVFVGPSQAPRMSIVKEEDEAEASLRARRESILAASLRRSSFESGTTALDTPNMEGRLSVDFGEVDLTRAGKRGLLSALVAPPSDVPEVVEPRSNVSGVEGGAMDQRVQANSFSTQLEQLQKFVVNTKDERPDTGGNRSGFSQFIPITNLIKSRRPGTGQTRFSEGISVIRSKRLPSGHGGKPMCRQCFRAGFDCAMNLQLGEGTAGRKAFQDFVAQGGLEAMSIAGGEEKDGGGSVTASQALGRNYVEKLGEVAFGESALSRPVTRGMVHEMLEERSRYLAEQQKQKTVEDFLTELNSIKAKQDHEDELEATKLQEEEFQSRGPRSDRKSSLMTRPTGVTATQVDQNSLRPSHEVDNRNEDDNNDNDSASSASSDQLPFLADRWSIWRKVTHITVLGLWVFALQCLDSGYVSMMGFLKTALSFSSNSFSSPSLSLPTKHTQRTTLYLLLSPRWVLPLPPCSLPGLPFS